MFTKRLCLCLISASLLCSGAYAQQLKTFVDGTPAVAADVNANFATLLAEIQSLKAQVAALQPKTGIAALVGTWDLFNLDSTTFETSGPDFGMQNTGSEGIITFKSDGTFQMSQQAYSSSLHIINQIGAPCPGCISKSQIIAHASNGVDPEPDQSGPYTISGNIVSLGGVQATLSKSGETIYMFKADTYGIQLIILTKR